MFCVAKVPWAYALLLPVSSAAAADIEKARRVNNLSSRPMPASPNPHLACGSKPTLPRTEKAVNRSRRMAGCQPKGPKRRSLCDCNAYEFVVCHGQFPALRGKFQHHL